MNELWRRLLYLVRKRQFDRELAEEMQFHLDMIGRKQFGNPILLEEASHEAWGWGWLERFAQDIRYGTRILLRSPGFTVVAMLALAIGIGANTAIFSVVNAVLLQPLPYGDPDRLVMVWEWNTKHSHINTVTGATFADWKNRNHVFADIGYSWDEMYTLTGSGHPESVPGYTLSTNFLSVCRVQPILGRAFLPGETDRVVLLSYKLWQRRFGSDRKVIGAAVKLNDKDYTVVGVMPPNFAHPGNSQLWTPLSVPPSFFSDRKIHALRVVARLKRGVTIDRARAEMDALAEQIAAEHPDTNAGMGVRLVPIREFYTGDIRPALLVLQAAVILVLLIACGNVGNLLLARASVRGREVAIRLALGAGRGRLLRQFLTEALLLSLGGGALGLALALWGIQALAASLPATIGTVADTQHPASWIDPLTLLFTAGISVAAGLAFGAAPALRAHGSPGEALKAGATSFTETVGRARLRKCLVVSQLALSLMLLVGAGLMIRSFLGLLTRQLGFRTGHVLTLVLVPSQTRYSDAQKMSGFVEQVITQIGAIPGVESAGATSGLPLSGMYARRNFTIPGQPPLSFAQQFNAEFRLATPGYFRAAGIRLVKGRLFDERDRRGAAEVAIINERLVRWFFPGQDPIGKSISVADGATPEIRQIVGVVGDTRPHGLGSDVEPEIYRPFYQAYWPFFGMVIHTSVPAESLAPAVRSSIWSVDKDQPVNNVQTMEQLLSGSLAAQRTNTVLLALFGAIALLLATLGIYGVMAYSVTQRTRDIGIRMALGANRGRMLVMVMREAMLLASTGVCAGLVAAFAITRFMRRLLYGVSATDPATFIVVAAILSTVAILSAYLPARRASRVDPMVALRYE